MILIASAEHAVVRATLGKVWSTIGIGGLGFSKGHRAPFTGRSRSRPLTSQRSGMNDLEEPWSGGAPDA